MRRGGGAMAEKGTVRALGKERKFRECGTCLSKSNDIEYNEDMLYNIKLIGLSLFEFVVEHEARKATAKTNRKKKHPTKAMELKAYTHKNER